VKHLTPAVLLTLALASLSGCGDGFPDEEMHFGLEDKARPFAVVIEPPEAAPGETVTVTLLAQTPDPDELDITWRVALDYDLGLYETDEVERNYRDLPSPLFTADQDGFVSQTFAWTVPDSALLYSSALPEVLTDPAMVFLAEELIGEAAGSPPTRSAVDAWLKARTPAELALMDPLEREAVWALADRFACQVRFRGTLHTGRVIDVTRNLTIRHTGRLHGPNANANAQVMEFTVGAVEKIDATKEDLLDPNLVVHWYNFILWGERVADRRRVPIHDDWTYYVRVRYSPQDYTSPFDPTLIVSEGTRYNWYYYRQDAPQSGHPLFLTEDGDAAEMWDLGKDSRIQPDGPGSTFRLVTAVRDFRDDWVMYHAVSGTGVEEGIVEFVSP